MSTSNVGLTGTASSNSSSLFNGTSRFSSDFQNVISRSVAIASLPIQQLQSETARLQAQASEFGALNNGFTNLQSAIQQLETATTGGLLAASSSDNTVASPSVSAGAHAGTYTLNVTSLGSYTNTLSQAGSTSVTDPSSQNISAASAFTLTINGKPFDITPSSKTLDGLVTALNSNTSLHVQASVVNLGSSSSPDYRLSIQSQNLGADSIQLSDGSSDLLANISTGSPATYQVDGVQTDISSTSRRITLAPGLSVDLTGQSASGSNVVINVAASTASIQNALSRFANSFNIVADELQKNTGQSGGALQGNSTVYELTNALQGLGNFSSGSGNLSSLAALGLTFDKTGHVAFDAAAFSSATANQIDSLTSFLGDTSGGGFLQFANSQLNSIVDATTGLIPNATSSVQSQIKTDNALITTDQNRVNTLQANLTAQLAASDALVATLEQQYSLIAGIFQAQQSNVSATTGR